MRKFMTAFFVFTLTLSGVSMTAYAMSCDKDTVIDQAGDWFATLGKEGAVKDQILVKRKTERFSKCAQKEAEKASKEVQKSANDMKKKLGF